VKLLVTGGAGFIGSNFVRRALSSTSSGITSITVLDKLTYAGVLENLDAVSKLANFKFVKGDVCDYSLVSELIADVDAVINFAAESHVDRSINGAMDFVQTNIVGVQVLLDAIKNSERNIRFLQISTDEVYGSIESGSWSEDSPLLPNSSYSASKASGEFLARAYFKTHNLDVVITRCSNNYGPFHFPEKMIPLFITNLLEGKKVPLYGDGSNVRDWLHVDDHCDGILKVLTNGRSGEIYNIGGGSEFSNLELTNLIVEAMGSDKSAIEYVEDRKGHDFRYSVNHEKITRELGYQPKVDFAHGITATINWYKENRTWWENLKSGSK
jgi:dTDP-glucose 4,6-dehydratase